MNKFAKLQLLLFFVSCCWLRLQAQTQLLLNPGLEAPYVAVSSSHIATNWTDNA